jgi:hypothetical protein
MVGMNLIGFGQGAMAAVFFCGACEKILSVAPLEPPARMPEQPASKILLPS